MSDLIIRDFYGEEAYDYERLVSYAFHYKNPSLLNPEEYKRELVERDAHARKELTDLHGNSFVRKGAFRDGQPVSALKLYALEAWFDGHRCEMGGIGGVLSDPIARKSGAVSALMKQVLSEMREKGQILSHLSPFKTSFYRKYGYEHAVTLVRWTIPTEYLPQRTYSGMVHYENTESQVEEIKRVYRSFSQKYNLALDRGASRWEIFFNRHKAYETDHFSYLHRTDGAADGFLSYTVKESATEPMTVNVSCLYFADGAALRELLAFLGGLSSYTKEVVLTLPASVDISYLLGEIQNAYGKKNVRREIVPYGATRVVDVEAILRLAAYRGAGEVGLRIFDPTCPWNDKCFRVTFDDACIAVAEGDRWDAEMSINAFSAMILGAISIEDAMLLDGVKVCGNAENLKKMFYRKPLWIDDSF